MGRIQDWFRVPADYDVYGYNHRMVWHLARAYGASEDRADDIEAHASPRFGVSKMTTELADEVNDYVRGEVSK